MVTKTKPILFILFILFFCSCNTKKEDEYCDANNYTFSDNSVLIYPNSDELNLGDTLSYKVNIPRKQIEYNKTDSIDFIVDSVLQSIHFSQFISGIFEPSLNSFDIIVIKGNNSLQKPNVPLQTKNFLYQINNTNSSLEISIIPKLKGKFLISFSNAHAKKANSCGAWALYTLDVSLLQDNNIDLFEQWQNRPAYESERRQNYCFEVK